MLWLTGILGVIIGLFGFVLLRGAPYLPTLSKQVETALDLIALKPGDTLLELGCGDGKVLIAAAERGLNVVGYELNPILALISRTRSWKYRKLVKVVWGDFWAAKWPPHEGIFVFLLDPFMEKLNTKIVQQSSKPVKLVSFAFQVPGKDPVDQKEAVYLYLYK